jgi:hypothetical protein
MRSFLGCVKLDVEENIQNGLNNGDLINTLMVALNNSVAKFMMPFFMVSRR